MIAMTISGCCNGCAHIDLELDQRGVYVGDDIFRHYSLHCTHEKVCHELKKEASKTFDDWDEGD